jgi:hypothetical protein
MEISKEQIEFRNKILAGLELVHQRLIEFKKQKNTDLVIMQDGKIIWIKAKDL